MAANLLKMNFFACIIKKFYGQYKVSLYTVKFKEHLFSRNTSVKIIVFRKAAAINIW